MKVFLDDERPTHEGWHRAYWPDEAIRLLETGTVEEISLDHDLSDDARGTGYDVILLIEELSHCAASNRQKSSCILQILQRPTKCGRACSPLNSWKPTNNFPDLMELEYLLDSSFDTAFSHRPNLPWWPWVGSNFAPSLVEQ